MRNSSSPRRRYQGFSWISVEEERQYDPFRSTVGPTNNSLFYRSQLPTEQEDDEKYIQNLVENEENFRKPKANKEKIGSLIPRSSNFVNYSSNKYCCPYYIKPQLWEKFNTAPRFNEHIETDKIHNFYNYMHVGNVNPNPFEKSKQNEINKIEVTKAKLAELPSIQKYKM